MKLSIICTITVLLAIGFSTEIQAQGRTGFAGAPYVKYSPETGWAGGLTGLYYFRFSNDTTDRPSDISAGVMYSQFHQYSLGVNTDEYYDHDNYQLTAGLHYQQIPLDFFGVGNDVPRDAIDNYTPLRRGGEFIFTKNWIRTELGEGFNAGIQGEFRNDQIKSSQPGAIISQNAVPGTTGGFSNGLGAVARYDTRDNKYSTLTGDFEDIEAIFYGRALGSDFTFNRYTLDARRFIPVDWLPIGPQTLAFQAYGVMATGNEPFYLMSGLGGDRMLRGYYLLRFRDNDMALMQGEYRFPIWWRFSGVIFGGAGEVAHELTDFSTGGLHTSYGLGLRVLVVPKEHINARVDYGIGHDSKQLYFSILEAF
jgi:hypothetical protein